MMLRVKGRPYLFKPALHLLQKVLHKDGQVLCILREIDVFAVLSR